MTQQNPDTSISTNRRQDEFGRAYKGSQRHMQTYVADPARRTELDAALKQGLSEIANANLRWLSPLETDRYAELKDKAFWAALALPELEAKAREWWPSQGGPTWDAVAIAEGPSLNATVVLVEAKANVPEFVSAGMKATSPASIASISSALDGARESLGATADLAAWTGANYQLANRLAWTDWLRRHGQPAVFAHVLFANDASHMVASAADLRAAAVAGHSALGIASDAIADWSTTVVLPAVHGG